jgi:hypothetical protein
MLLSLYEEERSRCRVALGIDEKDAATVTIKYADARRGQVVPDVNASEVEDLAAKGVKQARSGRKPKA